MRNFRKHIDDFFREKLGKYTETPPPEAWDELSGRLDTLKPYVPGSSTRWFWHAGMVGMIAVLSFTVTKKIINKSKEKESQERLAENINSTTTTSAQILNANTEPGTLEGRQLPTATMEQTAVQDATAPTENNSGAAATNNNAQTTGSDIVAANTNNNTAAANGTTSAQAQRTAINTTALTAVNSSKQNSKGTNGVSSKKQTVTLTRNLHEAENMFGSAGAPVAKRNENAKATSSVQATSQEAEATQDVMTEAQKATNKNDATQKEAAPATPAKNTTKENPIAAKKAETEKAAEKKRRNEFERFALGIKAGYERGMAGTAAKYVAAPYVQYKISPKVSIVMQPAVKYATLQTQTIGDAKSYYKVNDDAKVTHVRDVVKIEGGSAVYTTTYNYSQTHDSIVKTNTMGGKYYEVDMPLLLQYNVSNKVAVYAGVNGTYGKKLGITEQTYEKKGIVKSVDNNVTGVNAIPEPRDFNEMISYAGTPLSEYTGPKYSSEATTSLRLGYMVGMSYEYCNRWMLDAMIQQSPLKPDVKEGYNVNIPLSSAYFRLSVGYKIKK